MHLFDPSDSNHGPGSCPVHEGRRLVHEVEPTRAAGTSGNSCEPAIELTGCEADIQLVAQDTAHAMPPLVTTIILLTLSNVFMTFAWYGHLKFKTTTLLTAVVVSWLIALPEYILQVPANRLGHGYYSAAQLKTIRRRFIFFLLTDSSQASAIMTSSPSRLTMRSMIVP